MSQVITLTPEQYQILASRTESLKESIEPLQIRLLHATTGIQTEGGELADGVKRHVFYNKPFDAVNAKEEIGDLLWYVALFCNAMEFNLGEIMALNIAKLEKRYPEKYTDFLADEMNRDLAAERAVLEDKETARVREEVAKETTDTGTLIVDGIELPHGVSAFTNDASYDRLCGICRRAKIHRTNTSGVCTPCGLDSKLPPSQYPKPVQLKVVLK